MSRQACRGFVIVALTLIVCANRGVGQIPPSVLDDRLKKSHNLDGLQLPSGDMQAELVKRLQSLQHGETTKEGASKLLDGKNNKIIEELKKLSQNKQNDPLAPLKYAKYLEELKKSLEQNAKNDPQGAEKLIKQLNDYGIKVDPKDLKGLEKLGQQFKDLVPKHGGTSANIPDLTPKTNDGGGSLENVRTLTPEQMGLGGSQGSTAVPPINTAPPETGSNGSGGSDTPQNVPENIPGTMSNVPNLPNVSMPDGAQGELPYSKQLAKMIENLQKFDPSIKDSKAWQDVMKRLRDSSSFDESRWKTLANRFDQVRDKYGKLSESQTWDKMFANKQLNWPKNLTPKLPQNMPNIRIPSGGGGGGGTGFSAPSFGGVGSFGAGGGQAVLWICVALAFAGIIYYLLKGRPGLGAYRGAQSLWPQDWTFNPALVRTREDLIKAFEYLAVRGCGEEAITWNHRHIASELGQRHQAEAPAADHLAKVYETARYCPPEDPLPEPVLEEARRDLHLLAGVARS